MERDIADADADSDRGAQKRGDVVMMGAVVMTDGGSGSDLWW